LWSDWQRRERWVPVLLNLEKYADFAEIVEQKLNAVQKAAWSIYLKASNDSARVLLEAGFEYVMDRDGVMIFRRRK